MTDQQGYNWFPSPCFGYPARGTTGRQGRTITRIIQHTAEGGYSGSLSWLTRQPAWRVSGDGTRYWDEGSSAHYLISRDGRLRAQLVREADAAWTAGNKEYNLTGINIEVEGYAADPATWTDEVYAALANLVAGIWQRHPTIPRDRSGYIGHVEVPNQTHRDPGPHFEYERVLTAALRVVAQSVPQRRELDAISREAILVEGGRWVPKVFMKYMLHQVADPLHVYGRPLTEARIERCPDGVYRLVQWFERARLEYHPDNAGTDFEVLGGHVGRELLELKGRGS